MKRRDFIKYGTALAGFGGACLICNGKNIFFTTKPAIQNPLDTRPCRIPFECMEIQEFENVVSCCPEFLKYQTSSGNIAKQNFDEIWNGQIYTDLRKRLLNGDFSMCNRDICCMYNPCSPEDIPSDYEQGPKEIKISYDFECNYNCITCRDVVKTNTPEEMQLYDEVFIPKILQFAKNVQFVTISLSGDALYSRHAKNLIKSLVNKYPDIKFNIHTNGFLLNEQFLNELNITNNINEAAISVNTTNRETYKKIFRTDGFDIVMNNVSLMSEWKKRGKINKLTLNFVVHLMNYKEMPEFVNLVKKLDAMALFTTYRPWTRAEYHKRYDEVAVFEPTNKHYKELVKILHNPIFKDSEHCYFEPRLADIANL